MHSMASPNSICRSYHSFFCYLCKMLIICSEAGDELSSCNDQALKPSTRGRRSPLPVLLRSLYHSNRSRNSFAIVIVNQAAQQKAFSAERLRNSRSFPIADPILSYWGSGCHFLTLVHGSEDQKEIRRAEVSVAHTQNQRINSL